jgi:membrane protease YdiL (CAAX protease family)
MGLAAIAVIVVAPSMPLKAILVLMWAWWSGTPWSEIGYRRPRNWAVTLAAGTVFGIAFKLFAKAVVMPLLGADPINPTYHYLAGNSAALPLAIITMIVSGGIAEETVFRGYLFERFRRLFGRSIGASAAIVAITSGVFALAHFPDQGLAGVEQATMTGLAFGTIYAVTGQLSTVMAAHAAFDLTAVAIIYLQLESEVAHFFFK